MQCDQVSEQVRAVEKSVNLDLLNLNERGSYHDIMKCESGAVQIVSLRIFCPQAEG